MIRLHLHLLSDSTGETLENIAKAALAQFDEVETIKHFWPMVRSEGHLDRVLHEIAQRPGLVIFTMVNTDVRGKLEERCRAMGLPYVAPLDPVVDSLSRLFGQEAKARPGRQHVLDAAYFRRVDAIQFTIAHDDGVGEEEWEEADIVLTGVSRSSKTPTSIYLANRGYKVGLSRCGAIVFSRSIRRPKPLMWIRSGSQRKWPSRGAYFRTMAGPLSM
jgi:regulator of PEP synthase PpsR (kinase-PPPase family)